MVTVFPELQTERDVLRRLAGRLMELAHLPEMATRQRQWTALKDLRPERPMVFFETTSLEDYVVDEELHCQDPALRGVEKFMRWQIRHAEEVGDDIVIEPCWKIPWQVSGTNYGVEIQSTHAQDSAGQQHGYSFTHPIHTPDDLQRLTPRTWTVDREATRRWAARLDELFGDILPVVITGIGFVHSALTQDAYKLIGNDNLLMWPYDEPEAIHRLMAYLREDRKAYFTWLQQEELLGLNNDWTFHGSACGYTTDLPQAGYAGTPRLRDLWSWMESQETTMHSPEMFSEFFLPYMAEVAGLFGLIYYGCCEPVHDRFAMVREAIPHVRGVSVSPWCDKPQIAELLGKRHIFSRKPNPSPMSGATPDWEALEQDLDATLDAAKDCHLEFIYRDVYRINGDRPRLRKWVELVRSRIG